MHCSRRELSLEGRSREDPRELKPARSAKAERDEELTEREGFEPSVEFALHTLSKRAPSTTRTSLHL